jgi:formamidopyrimidine-DNA glycosylase
VPELPEVETVCRGLNRATLQQSITGAEVRLPRTLAYPPSVDDFLAGITGRQFGQWQRRGKYLLATLQTADQAPAGWLGVHLRMTGQLLWGMEGEPVSRHCRIRWFLAGDGRWRSRPNGARPVPWDHRELWFVDQRTFGRVWWIPPHRTPEEIMTGMAALGPEPFSPEFSVDYLYRVTRHRLRPIKNALLDQALVAGIGNIYADESLFLSGIHPTVPSKRLGRSRLAKLHSAIQSVLTESIEAGGTTFSDFRDVHGINGNYGGVARVYDREGQPCYNCQTPIQRLKLAGRSAHYCPCCQR